MDSHSPFSHTDSPSTGHTMSPNHPPVSTTSSSSDEGVMTVRKKLSQVMKEAIVIDSAEDGKQRVLCPTCNKDLYDKAALRVHYKSVHLKVVYRCTVSHCPLWFNTKWSRNRHVANSNPGVHDGPNKPLPEGAIFADEDDHLQSPVKNIQNSGTPQKRTPVRITIPKSLLSNSNRTTSDVVTTSVSAASDNLTMIPMTTTIIPPTPVQAPIVPVTSDSQLSTSIAATTSFSNNNNTTDIEPASASSEITSSSPCKIQIHYLPLNHALEKLTDALQKTDTNLFFAFSIQSMDFINKAEPPLVDFHLMRNKIKRKIYKTFNQYKIDFSQMTDNFMKYYYESDKLKFEAGAQLANNLTLLESQIAKSNMNPFGMDPKFVLNRDLVDEEATTVDSVTSTASGLPLLNPHNRGLVGDNQRVYTIGEQVGKLETGSPCLIGFREDKRNKVVPYHPVYYDAWSSFGPTYDSGKSTCTLEDCLLLSWDPDVLNEVPCQDFATSFLQSYVRDHPDDFPNFDNDLEVNEEEQDAVMKEDDVTELLNTSGRELDNLSTIQHERLCSPSTFRTVSHAEMESASRVTHQLSHMVSRVKPGQIVAANEVAKLLSGH